MGAARIGFAEPRLKALLTKAEADLAEAPWFGGDVLTAADIVMCYAMVSADNRGHITDEHPHCRDWLERIQQYPSFKAALQKDGNRSMVLSI